MICSGCEDGYHDRCLDGQMNSRQTGPILCDCASVEHDYKRKGKKSDWAEIQEDVPPSLGRV